MSQPNVQHSQKSAGPPPPPPSNAAPEVVDTIPGTHPQGKSDPPPRTLPIMTMDRFHLKESKNPGLWICVPKGVAVNDLLNPEYWSWCAADAKFKRNSTIEVHWDDSSQFAELYVLNCGRTWASVALMRHVKLEAKGRAAEADSYRIEYNGPIDQHRIINTDNRTVLRAGFATQADAARFLEEHLRKLGG